MLLQHQVHLPRYKTGLAYNPGRPTIQRSSTHGSPHCIFVAIVGDWCLGAFSCCTDSLPAYVALCDYTVWLFIVTIKRSLPNTSKTATEKSRRPASLPKQVTHFDPRVSTKSHCPRRKFSSSHFASYKYQILYRPSGRRVSSARNKSSISNHHCRSTVSRLCLPNCKGFPQVLPSSRAMQRTLHEAGPCQNI